MKRATQFGVQLPFGGVISIHTLCEEGDAFVFSFFCGGCFISIHTLCEEGDCNVDLISEGFGRISIHTLCEEGDVVICHLMLEGASFQSTPSVKRATLSIFSSSLFFSISIHTLCEEGDDNYFPEEKFFVNFNPHPL